MGDNNMTENSAVWSGVTVPTMDIQRRTILPYDLTEATIQEVLSHIIFYKDGYQPWDCFELNEEIWICRRESSPASWRLIRLWRLEDHQWIKMTIDQRLRLNISHKPLLQTCWNTYADDFVWRTDLVFSISGSNLQTAIKLVSWSRHALENLQRVGTVCRVTVQCWAVFAMDVHASSV